jgi:hypothetical protein
MNHLTDALTHVAQAVVRVHTPKQMMHLYSGLALSDCAQRLRPQADLCSISDIV